MTTETMIDRVPYTAFQGFASDNGWFCAIERPPFGAIPTRVDTYVTPQGEVLRVTVKDGQIVKVEK